MEIKANEISSLIKEQIKHFDDVIELKDVGTVMTVGDGVSLIHGLDNAMLGELLAFLKEENVNYLKIFSERPTLNDVFLELTGKDLRD